MAETKQAKDVEVKWMRDGKVEHQLDELKMTHRYEASYHISKIDVEGSKKNNARFLTPINEDAVLQYAGRMDAGDPFPAIVILESKKLVLAGNNRLAAAIMLDQDTVGAYIVGAAEECAIQVFIRWNNGTESAIVMSDQEKIQQCIFFNRKCGMSVKDAVTKMFGKRDMYKAVVEQIRRQQVKDSLIAEGKSSTDIDEVVRDKESVLSALHPLCPGKHGGISNSKVLTKTYEAVKEHELNRGEAADLVSSIKLAKTEKDQVKVIHKFVEDHLEGSKQPRACGVSSEGIQFKATLSKLHRVLCCAEEKYVSFGEFDITDEGDIKGMLAKMTDLKRAFNVLANAWKKEAKR